MPKQAYAVNALPPIAPSAPRVKLVVDTRTYMVRANGRAARVPPAVAALLTILSRSKRPVSRDRVMRLVFSGARRVQDPASALRTYTYRARDILKPLGITVIYVPNPESSDLPGSFSLGAVPFDPVTRKPVRRRR